MHFTNGASIENVDWIPCGVVVPQKDRYVRPSRAEKNDQVLGFQGLGFRAYRALGFENGLRPMQKPTTSR